MIQRYYEKLWDIRRRRAAGEEFGFTLIELLIVIVVLGILAATVIFALSGVTSSSAVAACNSDAKSVEVAVAAYRPTPDQRHQLALRQRSRPMGPATGIRAEVPADLAEQLGTTTSRLTPVATST